MGPAKAIYITFALNTPLLARISIYLTKDYPVDSYVAFPRGYGSSSGKRGYSKHRVTISKTWRRSSSTSKRMIILAYP